MKNNKLIYLDTMVVNNKGSLHLEMYRKPQADNLLSSDNLFNFKHAVSPKRRKISTLVGELYDIVYIGVIIRPQPQRPLT